MSSNGLDIKILIALHLAARIFLKSTPIQAGDRKILLLKNLARRFTSEKTKATQIGLRGLNCTAKVAGLDACDKLRKEVNKRVCGFAGLAQKDHESWLQVMTRFNSKPPR